MIDNIIYHNHHAEITSSASTSVHWPASMSVSSPTVAMPTMIPSEYITSEILYVYGATITPAAHLNAMDVLFSFVYHVHAVLSSFM